MAMMKKGSTSRDRPVTWGHRLAHVSQLIIGIRSAASYWFPDSLHSHNKGRLASSSEWDRFSQFFRLHHQFYTVSFFDHLCCYHHHGGLTTVLCNQEKTRVAKVFLSFPV